MNREAAKRSVVRGDSIAPMNSAGVHFGRVAYKISGFSIFICLLSRLLRSLIDQLIKHTYKIDTDERIPSIL